MRKYEELSKDCKMLWKENYELGKDEVYTQVSAYVYDDKGNLLIVKNNEQNLWTIPGGHPEEGETKIESLTREMMEEAYILLKDIKYLGAVKVKEKNRVYYQLRYTAKVAEELEFKHEFEMCERKFVDLKDLKEYIKWSNGITFCEQIKSSQKSWR